MKTIILIGAIVTIFPEERRDPKIRLLDYLCAIRHWLDEDNIDKHQ